ncbi:hypothetical protein [Clostridium cylindrosporum]|uniref:Uncharacterized protein n=1 Tax=Clostridium cylindrosporum DSM 605 TaxID=1121307 RepID=A0A0J8D9S3_CLOCY|nr:hypothetical protein [Clostridium cylindrosporum]KMT22810.1 hypothetical protein CLCY_5c00490 [Clostridium cylindrosporum DSM 605]
MILNASNKIAVKCSECGKYNVSDFNMFNLKVNNTIRCNCNKDIVLIGFNATDIILKISCIACDNYHIYNIKRKDILEKNINIVACPDSGMEIAFFGKTPYIDDIIEKYMNDMLNLLKFIGVVEDKSKRVLK